VNLGVHYDDQGDYEQALAAYQRALSLQQTLLGDQHPALAATSKLALAERAATLYDRAIATALELHGETGEPLYQEAAFRFAEKSRSGILLDALSDAHARQFAGIPDRLLDEEETLRVDLAFHEHALSKEQLRGRGANAPKVALWRDKLFGLRQAYDTLLAGMEEDYPAYYDLKYRVETASLAQVRDWLPDDRTALLEYFTGTGALYALVVTKSGWTVKALVKDGGLETAASRHRRAGLGSQAPRGPSGLQESSRAPLLAEGARRGVRLLQDGVLHLGEVYNLKLDAELVVLSACETGLGRVARGEGIIGLTRAFLYAGAASILVSLWQVSDESTSDLMLDFYDGMLRRRGRPEALRQAKLRLIRRQPEYAAPYYWAPFVLVGS
jgi:hypothetical protein